MIREDLLVIDPQIDFCRPNGALYVNGADKDMERLAAFVKNRKREIFGIHVTMDCHQPFDISHPVFWIDEMGQNPKPFTPISLDDVKNGVYKPALLKIRLSNGQEFNTLEYCLDYEQKLKDNGRYVHMIWPPHCLIGSEGNAIMPSFYEALTEWTNLRAGRMIDFVTKGSNLFTEHYSAVQADVPMPSDPSTQLNTQLINLLKTSDKIWLAGEALDYCLANTVRDIANNFGEENIKKFILLIDCTSEVGVPAGLSQDFLNEMTKRGMQVMKSTDI